MEKAKEVLVSGASGLVGRHLCKALESDGYIVRRLSRGRDADFRWDVHSGHLDVDAVRGVHAVIHLAGESVAQRWTEDVKGRILDSRVKSTQLLANAIIESGERPVFLSASGISFYGNNRAQSVDETAASGEGFLAEVARQWEAAAGPLIDTGCRVVHLRTGVILSKEGGALAKMLTPFKWGLGGRIGNGQQQMSWLSLPDMVNMYLFALQNEAVIGAVNAVAPHSVSNLKFAKTLGFVLGRPAIFPLPCGIIKALFSEMGKETVLSDLSVVPHVLETHDFKWQHPDLEEALRQTIYDL